MPESLDIAFRPRLLWSRTSTCRPLPRRHGRHPTPLHVPSSTCTTIASPRGRLPLPPQRDIAATHAQPQEPAQQPGRHEPRGHARRGGRTRRCPAGCAARGRPPRRPPGPRPRPGRPARPGPARCRPPCLPGLHPSPVPRPPEVGTNWAQAWLVRKLKLGRRTATPRHPENTTPSKTLQGRPGEPSRWHPDVPVLPMPSRAPDLGAPEAPVRHIPKSEKFQQPPFRGPPASLICVPTMNE